MSDFVLIGCRLSPLTVCRKVDSDTFTYGYEANSNLLASLTAPQHSVSYTYESNRNVMTSVDNQVSGSSLSKYAYSYDALGRRADREQSGSAFAQANTDTFAYNTRSEVIGSTNDVLTAAEYTPTYTYDQIGNRTGSTGISPVSSYVTNEVNQYTALDSTNPTHDLDGNLTGNGAWTYEWNGENRLQTATDGNTTINFLYDYLGRLVKKDNGTKVEVYVYDGWNRIAKHEVDSSFLILNSSFNLWGLDLSGSMQGAGGVGGLLKEGGNYALFDGNGNVTQKIDGAGVEVMNVDYDSFGNIIRGTLTGEYGFSTKPLTDQIDWYYYGFRYYDPVTGRWPNRDPIGEPGGLNLYCMFRNDSINVVDTLGLAYERAPEPRWEYAGKTGKFEWQMRDTQSYSMSFTNKKTKSSSSTWKVTASVSGDYRALGVSGSYSKSFTSSNSASAAATSSFSFSFDIEEKMYEHLTYVTEWETYYTKEWFGVTGTEQCESGDVDLGIESRTVGVCLLTKRKCAKPSTLRRVSPEEYIKVFKSASSNPEYKLSGDVSGSGNSKAALRTHAENRAKSVAQAWFNAQ